MALTKEAKLEIIGKHGRSETDTGSSEVQIALLTTRINELSEPEMPIATPCSWRPATCVMRLVITGRSTPLPNADTAATPSSIVTVYVRPSDT